MDQAYYIKRFNSPGTFAVSSSIPVAKDTATAITFNSSGASITSDPFTVGNHVNRALFAICFSDANTRTISTVTYATGSGGTWAFIGRAQINGQTLEIWRSTAPAIGSTTVTSTWSAVTTFDNTIIVFSLYNVNQTTPESHFTSDISETTVSLTVTSDGVYDMAIVGILSNGDPGAITVGTEDGSALNNADYTAGHNGGGAINNTVAWTTNENGRNLVGCNVKAA